jgi:hypothetical protein
MVFGLGNEYGMVVAANDDRLNLVFHQHPSVPKVPTYHPILILEMPMSRPLQRRHAVMRVPYRK